MAAIRMLFFHLRRFGQTGYFVQLLVTSTLSMLGLLLIGAYAYGGPTDGIWLQAGMVGVWSVTTVAAGIIGFQRFQGTLAYLVFTPFGAARSLLPLVASASTFGLLAFPIAALGSTVFGHPPGGDLARILVGALVFWLACLSLSCVVAALFVLSPNALTYEPLLLTPVILMSGVFGAPSWLPIGLDALRYVLPTSSAVSVLRGTGEAWGISAALSVAVSLVWFGLAAAAQHLAVRRATVSGTLDVV